MSPRRLVLLLFLMLLPAVASAQSVAATAGAMDVSIGATYVRDSVPTNMIGGLASASRLLSPSTSVVLEVGRHTGEVSATLSTFPPILSSTRYTETTAAGGVRLAINPSPRAIPFAQLLVGINARRTERSSVSSSHTTWQLQPELGVDFLVSDRIGLRTQFGWRYLMDDSRYRNQFRASVGVLLRFAGP